MIYTNKRLKRLNRQIQWHDWYAWHPVNIRSDKVWLQVIKRQRVFIAGMMGSTYNYRIKEAIDE